MNKPFIRHSLSLCIGIESLFLMLTSLIALIYHERGFLAYFLTGLIVGLPALYSISKRPKNSVFFAKEGFVLVALSWIVLSMIGAIPLLLLGEASNFVDALFEIVSGFTTTGATIMNDVTALTHATLFWRSFTHWIGGMGMLVFALAILPGTEGRAMYIMKAEAPGPSVGKLVSKLSNTAKILYGIYAGLTLLQVVSLLLCRMPIFDSIVLSLATAGTGGFGILNDSFVSYSTSAQLVTTIFMIIFGVNFNVYYYILIKDFKAAYKCEEVHWYFGIIIVSVLLIAFNITSYFGSFLEALKHAFFNVGSVITTTGFASNDFNTWPEFSKTILLILMFIGACAGSTGGGVKVSRLLIIVKKIKLDIQKLLHPQKVEAITMDGKVVDTEVVNQIMAYFCSFIIIVGVLLFLVSFDNFDFETTVTSVMTCIGNVGPGFGLCGPMGNFSMFSDFSKIVLSVAMLIGRLEIYPIIIFLAPLLNIRSVSKTIHSRKKRRSN